ncbi:hypothetical protein HDU98_008723 [Podochytrium sp. JEL0797]|nr:hypothetical protein HDU98_008723 [Podochytrium sp. JEL0797]
MNTMNVHYPPLSQQHHAYTRAQSPNSSIHPSESASNVGSAQNIAHQQAVALAKAQAQIRTRQAQLPFASNDPYPSSYPAAPQAQSQPALPNPSQFFSQQPNQPHQFQSSQFFPLDNPAMALPLPLPMPNASSSTFGMALSNQHQQPLPFQHATQESHQYHTQFTSTTQLPLSSTLLQMPVPNQLQAGMGAYGSQSQPLPQQQQQQQQQQYQQHQTNDLNPSEKWGKFFAQDNDDDDATTDHMVSPVHALPSGTTQGMVYQHYGSTSNHGSDVGYNGGGVNSMAAAPGGGSYFLNAELSANGNGGFQQQQQQVRSNQGSEVGTNVSFGSVSFFPQGGAGGGGMQQQQQQFSQQQQQQQQQHPHSTARIPPRLKYASMPYTTYDTPYSARLQESRQFFNDEPIPHTPQSNVSANFALLTVLDDIKKDANAREYGITQQLQFQQQQQQQQQYEDTGNGSAVSMNSQAGQHHHLHHPQFHTTDLNSSMGAGDAVNSPTTSTLSAFGPGSVAAAGGAGSSLSTGGGGPGPKGVFACHEPGCNKTFDRAQKLKSHVVTHTAERPFICGYCNLGFQRNHDLTRHMRLHTNEKPHKCASW